MMDTGAGLSIITEKVCDVHGLKIYGKEDSYVTASNEKAKLLGVTDISLQFNDYFQLDIKGISV